MSYDLTFASVVLFECSYTIPYDSPPWFATGLGSLFPTGKQDVAYQHQINYLTFKLNPHLICITTKTKT